MPWPAPYRLCCTMGSSRGTLLQSGGVMIRRSQPAPVPGRRRRVLLRLGVAAIGAAIGFGGLALLWPKPDRSLDTRQLLTAADLAKPPARPVTLLVIGLDGNRLGDRLNGAAPRGPANADALVLVRIQADGPVQLLTLPPELAVQLPGQRNPLALGRLYRLGGVALVADAVRDLVGLGSTQPDRYLVLSRAALRQLVDGLGGIEANPPQEMRYRDRAQNLRIALAAGLQRLQGGQVEQLLRFRDPLRPLQSRSDDQQEVVRGLLRAMARPAQLAMLPGLLASLRPEVATNLSPGESLSLLAAGLNQGDRLVFSELPLSASRPGHGSLRQLSPSASPPLWPPLQAGGSP